MNIITPVSTYYKSITPSAFATTVPMNDTYETSLNLTASTESLNRNHIYAGE